MTPVRKQVNGERLEKSEMINEGQTDERIWSPRIYKKSCTYDSL